MRLPGLHSPERYAGLYVFDFGGRCSVGYTAEEVAILFRSGRFPEGKAFRIHRALPDGTLDLEQVSRNAIGREDALLFFRHQAKDARRDFDELVRLAEDMPPPCRLEVQLARTDRVGAGYLTSLLFAGERTHEISGWLQRVQFEGGDFVTGGPQEAAEYRGTAPVVIDRRDWPDPGGARTPDEVLATTDLAVQR